MPSNPLFSGDPSIRGIQALLKSPVKKDGKTDPSSIQRTNHRRSRGFTRGAEQFREGGDEKMIDLSTVKELRALRLPGMARELESQLEEPQRYKALSLRIVWLFS